MRKENSKKKNLMSNGIEIVVCDISTRFARLTLSRNQMAVLYSHFYSSPNFSSVTS